MRKLAHLNVPQEVQADLDEKQVEIDTLPTYEKKVARGKTLWGKKNHRIFKVVKDELRRLSSDTDSCHYCEDSYGDEIEHIWPKNFFPDRAFVWDNYLVSCGTCNGTYKKDRFALVDGNGDVVELTRSRNDRVIQPQAGDSLMIDPRVENPSDYFILDFETGYFLPVRNNDLATRKAEYTSELLGLNRDVLLRARQQAYRNFLSRVEKIAQMKAEWSSQKLSDEIQLLSRMKHQSVWDEMKKYYNDIAELRKVVDQTPELLN